MAQELDGLESALSDRYEIDRELGQGGMATVYLARDLKHDRRVAIKVLKPELAAMIGTDRFLAEIKTTARLQHPHILPLHDSGEADSSLFFVMPYVEGESLREKLDREKQLPVEEAVRIATEVAQALEYAHGRGVIHRDVKPANILLHDDRVLVADFGIALAVEEAGGTRLTETGLSVGTPQYMSPEQATGGRELDGRSDVYSLGCVLYEMLAGQPPHTGPTAQAIFARVLTESPGRVAELRSTVPDHVDAVVRRALEKLPADRFTTAGRFAEALADPSYAATPPSSRVEPGPRPRGRSAPAYLPWAVSSLLAFAVAFLLLVRPESEGGGSIGRVAFTVPIEGVIDDEISISPDGRHVVAEIQGVGLVVRDLGSDTVRFVAGSEGDAVSPTVSPDGRWIAYVDGEERELRRIAVEGGSPITIATGVPTMFGGAWGPDDTFVFTPGPSAGLHRIAVGGGSSVALTSVDQAAGETGHWWPQVLPDGRHILFSVARAPADSATIEVLDLDTGDRTVVLRGGHHGHYVVTGHLVFMRGETMWAVPLDLGDLTLAGDPRPVMDGIGLEISELHGAYAISESGTLAYISAAEWNQEATMVWLDRDGTREPVGVEAGQYLGPRISPDGRMVAFERTMRGRRDIWLADLSRAANLLRLTGNDAGSRLPRPGGWSGNVVWMPDGRELVYALDHPQRGLYRKAWTSDGPGDPIRRDPLDERPGSVSPDGRTLAFVRRSASLDIWLMSLVGDPDPRPFRATSADETAPTFSPDGRWIAYESDETGRPEVWLEPFGDTPNRTRRQLSPGGGGDPRWVRSGQLFYRNGPVLRSASVDVETGAVLSETAVHRADSTVGGTNDPGEYDVSPDGRRVLMLQPVPAADGAREITVVVNWFDELTERMGGG